MSKYNELLETSVQSIARTFQRRTAAGLQGDRGFVIPVEEEQVRDATDFLLVSWLVIANA